MIKILISYSSTATKTIIFINSKIDIHNYIDTVFIT